MSATVLMQLIAEPDSAGRLSDLLAEMNLAAGWHESAADLVGGTAPYRNQRERVRGRRPRVRFELVASPDEVRRISADIDRRFADSSGVAPPLRMIIPLVGE